MAGLAQLTRDQWIVLPSVVAIALLLLLFQQGFCFFNLRRSFYERSALSGRASRLRRSDGVHDRHTALYSAVC